MRQNPRKGRNVPSHPRPVSFLSRRAKTAVVRPAKSSSTPMRRGAATVELAICLPFLITLVFGAIEASNMIFVKQAITAAAYEGARTATRPNGNNGQAISRTEEFIRARNIRGTKIRITRQAGAQTARGTPVTVHVTADCDANSVGPSWYFGGKTLSTEVTMVQE